MSNHKLKARRKLITTPVQVLSLPMASLKSPTKQGGQNHLDQNFSPEQTDSVASELPSEAEEKFLFARKELK